MAPGAPRAWRLAAVAGLSMLTLAVGASRVYLGTHYLTDVVSGVVLGLLWFTAGLGLLHVLRARTAGTSPMPPSVTARRVLPSALLLAALVGFPAAAQPAPDRPAPAPDGLRFESADGRLALELNGTIQADARLYLADAEQVPVSQFLVRRARVEIVVDVSDRFRFHLEPDFGEGEVTLADGWIEAELGRGVRARAGRFKSPFGLESLASSRALRFAERGLPTALSPRRDLGVMLHAERGDGRLEAALGVFNGVPDGQSESGEPGAAKDVVARVFVRPFGGALEGSGVGLAASVGQERGTTEEPALADYETPGGRPFFAFREGVVADGRRVRLGPQAYIALGPVAVLAEYTLARNRARAAGEAALLTQRAWQVAAAWSLTGERQRAEPLLPNRPLGAGAVGAVEVAARLHGLYLDPAALPLYADPAQAARRAVAGGLAVNWYPTASARLGVTLERTAFSRGTEGTAFVSKTLLVIRAQLAF